MAAFDVFLSYAHVDRALAHAIGDALTSRGLCVWSDESQIADFAAITRSVATGLRNAKALLAVYSAAYPTRRACQWELTAAFLASQRHGEDPRRRVLVVNPERTATGEARTDHIHPVELRDSRFRVAPAIDDDASLGRLADSVSAHIAQLSGPLGEVSGTVAWHGRAAIGSARFVGRVTDMWMIHSALQAGEVGVITGARGGALAQVTGLGGIGKSQLAEEYALRFGGTYPGGVFWLRASGDERGEPGGGRERSVDRDQQIRAFAVELGVQAAKYPPDHVTAELAQAARLPLDQVIAELARALDDVALPYLWIVDDLPHGLRRHDLDDWLAPGRWGRTLVTTRSRSYGSVGTQITLGVLPADDAEELLYAHRRPRDAGDAVDAVEHELALDEYTLTRRDAQLLGGWQPFDGRAQMADSDASSGRRGRERSSLNSAATPSRSTSRVPR
jgi:hypothetical protein